MLSGSVLGWKITRLRQSCHVLFCAAVKCWQLAEGDKEDFSSSANKQTKNVPEVTGDEIG